MPLMICRYFPVLVRECPRSFFAFDQPVDGGVQRGGHPDTLALGRALNDRGQIDATEWAPTLARLLEVPWP